MIDAETIYLIDDDPAVVKYTTRILTTQGLTVVSFPSADGFFESEHLSSVGCVVCDLSLPGIQGTEVVERLHTQQSPLGLIVISGRADVPTAVQLMKQGVTTVLEKPFSPDQLLDAIREGLTRNRQRQTERQHTKDVHDRLGLLTQDELDVLNCLTKGKSTKAIAAELHLSLRTVDRRRHTILHKTQLSSIPELIAFAASSKPPYLPD